MNGIIRWYNQNRKQVWKVIGIFAVIIIVIQLIQGITVKNENKKLENVLNSGKNEIKTNTIIINDEKSTITGSKLSNSQKKVLTVIDEFVEYCNNKQVSEAYNILSEDCKNQIYSSENIFQEKYLNKIFDGSVRNILAENWVGNIYKVKFREDALSTGIYDTDNVIQDYITGTKDENGDIRLNINGYIGKYEINKQDEKNNIKITVIEKHQYMDYETYVFEIKNNSNNTILLNDIQNEDLYNQNAMYLEDKNNIQYNSYTHELSEGQLKILSRETRKISIKYHNKYSSNKKIENIVFSKIILDYNEYLKTENTSDYTNYGIIQIDL